jgi:threonine aldolase
MFGGALPAAWPQVALVEHYATRFEADYAQAWRAADALVGQLQASGRYRARKLADGTCRFFLSVDGSDPAAVAERLRGHDIILPQPHPDTGEFALQVNPTLLRIDPGTLARRFLQAAES